MSTLTIVICSLSVLSVETFEFYSSSSGSHQSPVSAWLNRNQAEALEGEFQSPWISDMRLRSSKVAIDKKPNLEIPAASILNEYRQIQDAVNRETKLQSVQIAEAFLKQYTDTCVINSYCKLGQNLAEESKTFSSEYLSVDFLKRMLSDVMENPEVDRDSFPELTTIRSIVAAFELGRKTGKNTDLCNSIFPCSANSKRQGRGFCNSVKSVCPGLAISCSMCGIFNPQLCRRVCIVTAGSCGLSLYSCIIDKAVTENKAIAAMKAPTSAATATSNHLKSTEF